MLKAQAKEEYLVSFRQIVKNSGIGDSSLRWQAKKAQLRMWKMNGVRVIEIYCAINLLKFFRDIKKNQG